MAANPMQTNIKNFITKRYRELFLVATGIAFASVLFTRSSYPSHPLSPTSQTAAVPGVETAYPKAPVWELKDVEGKLVKSSDFLGKVVVLDFWATWCPPCRAEIPGFVKLQTEYRDKGLVVVGVSLDQGELSVVKNFMKQSEMNYPVVIGDQKIAEDFGDIQSIPTTFIIDRNGNVTTEHVGYGPFEAFETKIKKLL